MALNINQVIKWDALKAAIDKMSDRLARKNGYYSTLTAGAAERLIVCDNVESQFFTRGTGGIAEIAEGVALIDKMRGNSMVWNQLVNGSSVTVPNGHTYLLSDNGTCSIATSNGSAISVTEAEDNIFNLTAMFGTTANAAAALGVSDFNSDQNKTDAINKFKELYPLDYYAYNVGSIVSFNGNTNCQIQSISRNLISNPDAILNASGWVKNADGSYQGNIDALYTYGNLFGLSYKKNTRYTMSVSYEHMAGYRFAAFIIQYTDGTSEYGNLTGVTGRKSVTSAQGKDISEVRIVHYQGGSTYRLWDFQIEVGTTATAYEPYISSLCTLPAYTLRGIGSLKDEIEGNVLTRRIGTRAYQSGDENEPTYLTDKTNTLYPLATPTTQTISEWDNSYDVYPNGTEALIPANGTTPHTTLFDGVIDYTIDAVEVLRNINENFVSTKQSQGLTTAKQANARNNISVYSKAEVDAMIVTALNDNY